MRAYTILIVNSVPPESFFYLFEQIVYRRYASLFFICAIDESDNELTALEIIHRYVEVLDRYFGEVR